MVSTFRRYFTRHMNALRIAAWGMPVVPQHGPVIVYSNHPAWWDAAVYILAADRFFPSYESYAPIDAAMLKQYGIFGRIGAFGIDLESPRGAADFLKAGAEILSVPDRALWITAQGRFSDVRERPLGLKPGVAHLVERAPGCTILPLAIEYGFWLERGAEAFLAFGQPMRGSDLLNLSRADRLERLESELTSTLTRLSADVESRDPARFRAVLEGRAGIGGLYDGWRRMAAALRGRTFDPSHEGRPS
ncbi:lysophospholipid acyltransferase family protein [Microvirga mediterraneensis]|uniref:1-acyl-sn-glycerol-3-phosphate acyltransferase n=1 Tax=Microvirga mediterraneensis TaxID=2754695 RepID=A0A838BKA0_9HYPH|nr:lysophospholipid acyltransferase family protein [Microvirga mediterraneensis]MBA1154916.1 1-acyl-sn-glycerol-3-phosphate acyltransferase [Microvirga mediterraneensis]